MGPLGHHRHGPALLYCLWVSIHNLCKSYQMNGNGLFFTGLFFLILIFLSVQIGLSWDEVDLYSNRPYCIYHQVPYFIIYWSVWLTNHFGLTTLTVSDPIHVRVDRTGVTRGQGNIPLKKAAQIMPWSRTIMVLIYILL